jgi:para-aminobenzoate synthetase/4-amino-4-deoxychorismate lyase
MNDFEHLSCTILLDDAQSSSDHPSSRLYQSPLKAIQATNADTLDVALAEIEQAIHDEYCVVTCFSYELGEYLLGLTPKKSKTPWVQAWVFKDVEKLSKEQVSQWLMARHIQAVGQAVNQITNKPAITNISNSITQKRFEEDISKIHEWIKSGDTYQVNHTYRIHGELSGSPLVAYEALRQKQPGPYGAFIEHNNGWVLSCSPEWFLQKTGSTLMTKPMKGTAKVGESSSEELHDDAKNRAENVMIVDLLRNDLSKISLPGTVKVPHLFEVQQYGDVLQMTSTISSTAKENLRLKELLKAIFPCGSVTGAPKKRTMELIQVLESEPRNLYCGAIAWFDPSSQAGLGDLGMSVVIRTLELEKNQHFQMGVGGGITIDSESADEWHECQTKAGFLYGLQNQSEPLGLFETIRIEKGQARHLEMHLDRISQSANELKINFDSNKAVNLIQETCSQLNGNLIYRLRFDLSAEGLLSVKTAAIQDLQPGPILWASDLLTDDTTMSSSDRLLGHKVTRRKLYDQAWLAAEKLGAFDALFINEQGFVTEGGRSNVFVKKDGQWLTPPLASGCLPGVMRSMVLKDVKYQAVERNITRTDVLSAEEVIFTNALRGIVKTTN